MTNNGTTTEQATVIAGKNRVYAFESVEKIIQMRCNQILEIAGKGNFDHPLMTGFVELQSLNDQIIGLKNIQREKAGLA